jgi:hypothetical protein
MEYGQVEPMSPFERILEIPSGECTVDVGVEPIAQSPSDQQHTKMTTGQAHAGRRSQSEEIRFVVCSAVRATSRRVTLQIVVYIRTHARTLGQPVSCPVLRAGTVNDA